MALVVTIVVLIILATVSMNAVLGENGLIKQAKKAKEMYENSVTSEEQAMNQLLGQFENSMQEPAVYDDNTLPTAPKITEGMTKVKYDKDSNSWKKVTDEKEAWYNYSENAKEWANVVMPADEDAKNNLFTADGTLDESKKYVQLVWIPRYAYQITSQYHQAGTGAGNVNVVFVDSSNRDREGKEYSTTYPSYATGSGMEDYVVHPAFEYDGKHLTGFWMGKFEASNTNCTTDPATGNVEYTTAQNYEITTKPSVTSWRNIKIGDAFVKTLDMNKSGNPYGLNTNDNIVDPHMVKNTEWGAVAYLSKSKYGKETEEVYINNNSNYITGIAGDTADAAEITNIANTYKTDAGMKASTNGNPTGIYDMSGGNWERVAAYITNGHNNLTDQGIATDTNKGGVTAENTPNKYRNVYESTTDIGDDTRVPDYNLTEPNKKGKYGDAIWEISGGTGTGVGLSYKQGWYSDYSDFSGLDYPFFYRGGYCKNTSVAGVFSFYFCGGGAAVYNGFRVVVSVLW